MIEHLPVRTERVVVRTLRVTDLDAFLAFRGREDVARFQGWSPLSEATALAFLRQQATETPLEPGVWKQLGIAGIEDDVLIGDIGVQLSADGTSAEIGVSMHPDRQGLGLASEAVRALIGRLFAHTPVRRIVARTDSRNEAGIRSLGKVGMRRVSTRPAEYKGEGCIELEFVLDRPRTP